MLSNQRRFCLGCVALLLLLAGRLGAHTLPISFLQVVPGADYLHLELALNPFELSFFSELETHKDGRLDPEELAGQEALVARRILDCLKVRVAGKPVVAEVSGITPDVGSHHFTLRAQYRVDARSKTLELESSLATITSGSHLTQVTFTRAGQRQLAQLDMQSSKVTFDPPDKVQGAAAPGASARGGPAPFAIFLLLAVPCLTVLAVGWWRFRKHSRQAQPALH